MSAPDEREREYLMADVLLIAPRFEPGMTRVLAAQFGTLPGIHVLEDRRTGKDRRQRRAMYERGHRTGRDRRLPLAPPRNAHFLGFVRWQP